MAFIDDLCISIGRIGRSLFEVVSTIWDFVIKLVDHVLSWARDFVSRCWTKIQEGWRMYYVDLDVDKIPPHVIPKEMLRGATKVSLGLATDKNMNNMRIDKAFVHNTEDESLRKKMAGKNAIEITL